MTEQGGFIEVQGTAEGEAYSRVELEQMLVLAEKGINELIVMQKAALAS
jgi:ribonuclease PH